ncbi:hypothetical protein PM082_002120 [Marasmius tenuissimus]|nr:hypothetical protein PM082_002120 [Marasmius tenuissimus]
MVTSQCVNKKPTVGTLDTLGYGPCWTVKPLQSPLSNYCQSFFRTPTATGSDSIAFESSAPSTSTGL